MLFSVLTSSAVGLAGLLIAPAPGNALATPGSGSELGHLAARRLAGVSPNHHALARRKTNTHKKRQRCQQRPVSPNSTPAPQQTDTSPDEEPININVVDNSGGNNNNNINNPVTTPTIPTTPPVATYTPPATGGGKLILAWPNQEEPHIEEFFRGRARYYYNWSAWKAPGADAFPNIEFCPMFWGYKGNNEQDFKDLVKPGYANCVLGMNEVNQPGQAYMSVDDAVSAWYRLIAPLKDQGYTIRGSPSTTSAPDGLVWMKEFLSKVDPENKPTHICVHWYDVKYDDFVKYVTDYYEACDKRTIWVTEFACQNFNGGAQCSYDQIRDFINNAVGWMDSTNWIGGYAPFVFGRNMDNVNPDNRLITDTGYPTEFGHIYIGV